MFDIVSNIVNQREKVVSKTHIACLLSCNCHHFHNICIILYLHKRNSVVSFILCLFYDCILLISCQIEQKSITLKLIDELCMVLQEHHFTSKHFSLRMLVLEFSIIAYHGMIVIVDFITVYPVPKSWKKNNQLHSCHLSLITMK